MTPAETIAQWMEIREWVWWISIPGLPSNKTHMSLRFIKTRSWDYQAIKFRYQVDQCGILSMHMWTSCQGWGKPFSTEHMPFSCSGDGGEMLERLWEKKITHGNRILEDYCCHHLGPWGKIFSEAQMIFSFFWIKLEPYLTFSSHQTEVFITIGWLSSDSV